MDELANQMASKLMVRSHMHPQEDWAILIHRHIDKPRLKDHPRWRKPPHLTLIWKAWNEIKSLVVLKDNKHAIPYLAQDSIWLPLEGLDQVGVEA